LANGNRTATGFSPYQIYGSLGSSSLFSSTLNYWKNISGSFSSLSSFDAILETTRNISGNIVGLSSLNSTIIQIKGLLGNISSTSISVGMINISIIVDGVIVSSSIINGDIELLHNLANGTVTADGSSLADSVTNVVLEGTSTSISTIPSTDITVVFTGIQPNSGEISRVARLGDIWSGQCYHPSHNPSPIPMSGPIITSSSDVLTNQIGTARLGDLVIGWCGHIGRIVSSSNTVLTNQIGTARLGDRTSNVEVGNIITSSSNVLAG